MPPLIPLLNSFSLNFCKFLRTVRLAQLPSPSFSRLPSNCFEVILSLHYNCPIRSSKLLQTFPNSFKLSNYLEANESQCPLLKGKRDPELIMILLFILGNKLIFAAFCSLTNAVMMESVRCPNGRSRRGERSPDSLE